MSLEQLEFFFKFTLSVIYYLPIFGGPKHGEDVNFCPPNQYPHLTQYGKETGKKLKEMSPNHLQVFIHVSQICQFANMLKKIRKSYSAPHSPSPLSPSNICVVPNWGYSAPHGIFMEGDVVPNSLNMAPHKISMEGDVVPNSFNLAPHKFCGGR